MRQILFFVLLAAIAIVSCSKGKTSYPIQNGTYNGTFQRQRNGSGAVSHVSLTFSANHWQGQSDSTKYPAVCSGDYSLSGNSFHPENTCAWTANFDWSFILHGYYQFSNADNHIEIWRDYPDGTRDIYKLTKQ